MMKIALKIIKKELFERLHLESETTCPCCGDFMKIYKRKLNSTVARALIRLYYLGGDEKYVSFNEFQIGKGGGFAMAKHFGLLVQKEKDPKIDKRASGYWKLSDKGIAFVRGETNIKKYVFIFRDKSQGYSNEEIDINGCLGEKFSYRELMNA